MSVAAVLPIPAQAGFRVRLPTRVRFAPDTGIESVETGLALVRNEATISISLVPAARDSLVSRLDESGKGLPTDGLAPTWRRLLERLAASGMLVESVPGPGGSESGRGVAALDALVALNDAIYEESRACFPPGSALDQLIAGRWSSAAAVKWLVENYHYTKSACYHITPVLRHEMDSQERGLWLRFLKDESWHSHLPTGAAPVRAFPPGAGLTSAAATDDPLHRDIAFDS